MHVLLITPNYPNRISPRCVPFFTSQARALVQSEVKVGLISVVSVPIFKFFKIFRKDIRHQFPVVQMFHFWIPFLYPINQYVRFVLGKILFKRYVKRYGKPDVIHLHVYNSGRLAIWISECFNIPYVVTEHYSSVGLNKLTRFQYEMAKRAYSGAKLRFAVSGSLSRALSERYSLAFDVMPNVVDDEFFFKSAKKLVPRYVLNVANMVSIKGHTRLIDAFAMLSKMDPDLELKLVGDGPLKAKLKERVISLGLQNKVTFIPSASRQEVAELMRDAQLFVLASDYETFGVVLIEAMACGTAVVATNVGGIPDLVDPGVSGMLCEPNVGSLAQAMFKALATDFDSEKISQVTRNQYGVSAISGKLLASYRQVLNQVPGGNSEA